MNLIKTLFGISLLLCICNLFSIQYEQYHDSAKHIMPKRKSFLNLIKISQEPGFSDPISPDIHQCMCFLTVLKIISEIEYEKTMCMIKKDFSDIEFDIYYKNTFKLGMHMRNGIYYNGYVPSGSYIYYAPESDIVSDRHSFGGYCNYGLKKSETITIDMCYGVKCKTQIPKRHILLPGWEIGGSVLFHPNETSNDQKIARIMKTDPNVFIGEQNNTCLTTDKTMRHDIIKNALQGDTYHKPTTAVFMIFMEKLNHIIIPEYITRLIFSHAAIIDMTAIPKHIKQLHFGIFQPLNGPLPPKLELFNMRGSECDLNFIQVKNAHLYTPVLKDETKINWCSIDIFIPESLQTIIIGPYPYPDKSCKDWKYSDLELWYADDPASFGLDISIYYYPETAITFKNSNFMELNVNNEFEFFTRVYQRYDSLPTSIKNRTNICSV